MKAAVSTLVKLMKLVMSPSANNILIPKADASLQHLREAMQLIDALDALLESVRDYDVY